MKAYRLTEAADADLGDILRYSARVFGPLQRDAYASLIEAAAVMVADQPGRPGSRDRHDLAEGVRSFHIELAAGRRGAASHVLYYVPDRDGVIIVRVLHQGMEPGRHLGVD